MRRVRLTARRTVRRYGMLTAAGRALPDFLIIGAKRGGTTSLYRYLAQHPDVLPLFPSARSFPMREDRKGVHYFDSHHDRGLTWYRSHFALAPYRSLLARQRGRKTVTGEASPYYLFHPQAAGRAAVELPEAKLIVLLRNPVERAYSHWRERRRERAETLEFAEALAIEPSRLEGEHQRLLDDPGYRSLAHEHQSYLTQSLYLEPLSVWLAAFPRGQFCILRSEDLYREPQATVDRVCSFLGLPLQRLAGLEPWNATAGEGMSPAMRQQLSERVVDHNRRLADLLGMDLGWDLEPAR